ncbi:MAG: hypothetical protein CVU20_06425 [Betaproteobacteria bacterium HGW-Betaproteobacteria-14]|nr:MAG: hypothetical protein CVU20_06425 [Betaproteobacteria bacterium HGW-Betaproteobacteria-14]
MHRPFIAQALGAGEPRALARIVVELAHLHRDDLALGVPGNPVSLPAPFGRIADAVDPATLAVEQQEEFTARFVGEDDRIDLAVIGQDGEEEFVETQQLIVVQAAVGTPGLAAAQGHLDHVEQPGVAPFKLFGSPAQLTFGQAVHGRLADQHDDGQREGGQRGEHEQADTQYQAVGETGFSEQGSAQTASPRRVGQWPMSCRPHADLSGQDSRAPPGQQAGIRARRRYRRAGRATPGAASGRW